MKLNEALNDLLVYKEPQIRSSLEIGIEAEKIKHNIETLAPATIAEKAANRFNEIVRAEQNSIVKAHNKAGYLAAKTVETAFDAAAVTAAGAAAVGMTVYAGGQTIRRDFNKSPKSVQRVVAAGIAALAVLTGVANYALNNPTTRVVEVQTPVAVKVDGPEIVAPKIIEYTVLAGDVKKGDFFYRFLENEGVQVRDEQRNYVPIAGTRYVEDFQKDNGDNRSVQKIFKGEVLKLRDYNGDGRVAFVHKFAKRGDR